MFSAERLARILTIVLVAGFVALLYINERSRTIADDMTAADWARLGAASLVFVLPLFPTIAIPEFPVVFRKERQQRRWNRQRCPSCAHPFDPNRATRCTECGHDLTEPPAPFEFSFAILRRFAVLMVVAWALGVAIGETHARLDEHAFRTDLRQAPENTRMGIRRTRWWPATDRRFVPSQGDRFTVR